MNLEITPAAYEEKSVLRRLLELYLYDFSEFDGADVNGAGLYEYERLDYYWIEPERFPFLARVDGRLAGFALVRRGPSLVPGEPEGEVYHLAEFFVLRKYRRQGVGKQLAHEIFARFPGRWEVSEIPENLPAQRFWRRVIGAYTGGDFREVQLADGEHRGPVQIFTS